MSRTFNAALRDGHADAADIEAYLAARDGLARDAAVDELVVRCAGCGHDQDGHAPDNIPPYRCDVAGCDCSRTPDHLIVEAPPSEGEVA